MLHAGRCARATVRSVFSDKAQLLRTLLVPHFIGLDIGGANLKAAHVDGVAVSRAFPVWKRPERLTAALVELLASFPTIDGVAVTMTAELADCFTTKEEGVDRILTAVDDATAGKPVWVWHTGGEFASTSEARQLTRLVAAANWHALATWVGLLVPEGEALLLDVGTTTTDVIPLCDGRPATRGMTDPERLAEGELVYTGVRRTPLCAVAQAATYRDVECPLAAELFATTLDVWLTLGHVPEDVADLDTADGRPATKRHARDRLARMICCDRDEFFEDDALAMARSFAARQQSQIANAVGRVRANRRHENRDAECRHVVVSGSGGFLAERVLEADEHLRAVPRTRLADVLSANAAKAACALAVARLAAERMTS